MTQEALTPRVSKASTPPVQTVTVPLDTRRPFTRADALAAGISPSLLRGSRFRRLFRGIHIDSGVRVDAAVMAQAALLVHQPTAYASHTTAARVYRVPVPFTALEHVSVLRRQDRRNHPGIRSHVGPAGAAVTKYRGVRVSDAASTFLALASLLTLVDLVVAGDAMVRLGLLIPEQLVDATCASSERHAVGARRAARFVRRDVDSQWRHGCGC